MTRAIQVLKLIASQPAEGARLVDVSRLMELERPTAHRLLQALTAEGMLIQDRGNRRYRLGPVVFELGLLAAHQFNLSALCLPVLASLSKVVGDASFLFVRSGSDSVCLARLPGTFPSQTPVVPAGSRQPLGVNAGGLALLSALPVDESDEILRRIEPRLEAYAGLDVRLLRQHVNAARSEGYAYIANHAVPGIAAVGLPILSTTREPIAAVTVASNTARLSKNRIVLEVLPHLRAAAFQINALINQ